MSVSLISDDFNCQLGISSLVNRVEERKRRASNKNKNKGRNVRSNSFQGGMMSKGNAKAGCVAYTIKVYNSSENEGNKDNNNRKKEPYVMMQINNLFPNRSRRSLKSSLSGRRRIKKKKRARGCVRRLFFCFQGL